MARLPAALTRDVRALCAMVLRSGSPASQVAAEALLRQLVGCSGSEALPDQLGLFAHDGAPVRFGRLSHDDQVVCEHDHGELPAGICVSRHLGIWPGRNRKGDGTTVPRKAAFYPQCAACPVGALRRRSMRTGWSPVPVKLGGDFTESRKAMKRWKRERPPGEVPTIDHPCGAPEAPDEDDDTSAVARALGRG